LPLFTTTPHWRMAGILEILFFVLVALLILHLRQLWSHRHYPPGPFPLPVIGGMWQIGKILSPDTFLKVLLSKSFTRPHRKLFASADLILSFAKEELERHKEQRKDEPQDFIDFYLLQMEKSKDDPNSTYDESNLAECVLDLFIAGTETTAATLQWGLLLMVSYPDVQDKVYKEMEDVLGSSLPICYEDRKKLPYTNAVVHEILRAKYPLLIGIPRRCAKDMEMHGFHIPKRTVVVTDLNSVLVDPTRWETPEEFNPHHFLDTDGNFRSREEYLPFGAGARACVGEQMAKMEIFLFLTTLLRAFRFQLPEGVKELNNKPVLGLTLHPHPHKLCAIPRCSA
uniref:Uncharacterized protein n=1 Tax=Podarcis muralis TaxID=64176 RepID=A0A670K3D0_PODMU